MTIFFYGRERNSFDESNFRKELQTLKDIGCNAITLVPYRFMRSLNDTVILYDYRKTIHDDTLRKACQIVKDFGFKLILKPHIDIDDYSSRLEIKPVNLGVWQKSYTDFCLHYCSIAAETGADIFVVGTELMSVSGDEKFWRSIVKKCRDTFNGALTYASCPQESYAIKFWDCLDYIGTNAYVPVSGKTKPSEVDLLIGWEKWINAIEYLARKYDKKILFTEIGYRNSKTAVWNPGTWDDFERDDLMQANLYRAALTSIGKHKENVSGYFFWQWELNSKCGLVDYCPQGKKAQEVLEEFWLP